VIHIDTQYAITLLKQVVEERGEGFSYKVPQGATRCLYEWQGSPSCGVGAALHKAGVPVHVLAKLDDACGEIADDETREFLQENQVILTPDATRVLWGFQGSQDNGANYASALRAALEHTD